MMLAAALMAPVVHASDSPAQKTVRLAVGVCDWTVTASFETRIDCAWIGAGGIPRFDFFNGGVKTDQSITFQPLIPCHQSWSTYFMDGYASGICPVRVPGPPAQRYGSTTGFAGYRGTVNDCPPCVDVPSPVALRPVCRTTLPRDRNSWIEMGVGSGNVVSATFVVNAANPCVDGAPAIRADVTMWVRPMAGGPQTADGMPIGLEAAVEGSHRPFPTYELNANGITLHSSQHCILGSTPADLFSWVPGIEVGSNPLTWVQIR